jgi:hypothetical protein
VLTATRSTSPGLLVEPVRADGEGILGVDVPAQLLGSDAAVVLDGEGVEIGLAARTRQFAAADPRGLPARAADRRAAMERVPDRLVTVGILHHVPLADVRPVGGPHRPGGRPERPERRPVARRLRAADVRQFQRGLHPHRAARRRGEIGPSRLHPPRRPLPVARARTERDDGEVPGTVVVDVADAVGHGLELTGAPLRRAAAITGADAVNPVLARQPGIRDAVEVVAPHLHPRRRRRRW